ncbi:hypothetical protein HOY82DRAFT_611952 [Tuber indicum]|nr:hypothetical protein HOY82DRAFT_611952 [Tuber indicum]
MSISDLQCEGDVKHTLNNVQGLMADIYNDITNEYMDPHNLKLWAPSDALSLVKYFWPTVKDMLNLLYGIQRCFITGISSLSMADSTSGFNIAENMSFKKDLAGLCSLHHADVEGALFLDVTSASPEADAYVQCALTPPLDRATPYHLILYSELVDRYTLVDLQSRALGDVEKTTSCTLLLYFGALMFNMENPSKFLTIPYQIVVKYFGASILRRFALFDSLRNTDRFLALDGYIFTPLQDYQELMAARDIKHGGYSMTEITDRETIQIEFLDLWDSFTWDEKAEALNKLDVDAILKLKFYWWEKYRKGTLQRWIKNELTA